MSLMDCAKGWHENGGDDVCERCGEQLNCPAPVYATELTRAGEQTVIPGCERNESPRATQLDLFG